jgi:hypothetical protein
MAAVETGASPSRKPQRPAYSKEKTTMKRLLIAATLACAALVLSRSPRARIEAQEAEMAS